MELLGPCPRASRLSLMLDEEACSAFGGCGTEVEIANIGEMQYTANRADCSSLTLVRLVEAQYRAGIYTFVWVLKYSGEPSTGGTFRVNGSNEIPYNATASQLLAAFAVDPYLTSFGVGGDLSTELYLYNSDGGKSLTLNRTKLLPGARIVARNSEVRLDEVETGRNTVTLTTDGETLTHVVTNTRPDMASDNFSQLRDFATGVSYYRFRLRYTGELPDAGTFNLSGGLLLYFPWSSPQASAVVVWHTAEIPYDATGVQIMTAVVTALNLAAVPVASLSGFSIVPPVVPYTASSSIAPATRLLDGALSFEVKFQGNVATLQSGPFLYTGPITVQFPGNAQPIIDNSGMNRPNVWKYDALLNPIESRMIGDNVLSIVHSNNQYRLVCVSENSPEGLTNPTKVLPLYEYRMYDDSWVLLYTNSLYGDGVTPSQSSAYYTSLSQAFYNEPPLLHFSDDTFGTFVRTITVGTYSGYAYKRFTLANSVQFTTTIGVTLGTTLSATWYRLSHADIGDHIIVTASSGIARLDKNLVFQVQYNVSAAPLRMSVICAASDSSRNIYVLCGRPLYTSGLGTIAPGSRLYLLKFDFNLNLLSRVPLFTWTTSVGAANPFAGAGGPQYRMQIRDDIITIYGLPIPPNVPNYAAANGGVL